IDQQDRRVRAYKLGGTISTVIGTGIAGSLGSVVPVPAETALLNAPRGVAVDDAGVVFVMNSTQNDIVAVNPVKNTALVVAGDGTGADGIALTTSFNLPRAGLCLPPVAGKPKVLLVAEQSANRIRRIQYTFDATTGNINNAVTDIICGT